jgi:hypothetical protein
MSGATYLLPPIPSCCAQGLHYYYIIVIIFLLSPLHRVFTIIYLKQIMLLKYTVLRYSIHIYATCNVTSQFECSVLYISTL